MPDVEGFAIMTVKSETTRPYRPSNGTEGNFFYENWCARCQRESHGRQCNIFTRTLALDIGEKGYPKEWVRDISGWPGDPRCTAFDPAHPIVRSNIIKDKRQEDLQ